MLDFLVSWESVRGDDEARCFDVCSGIGKRHLDLLYDGNAVLL